MRSRLLILMALAALLLALPGRLLAHGGGEPMLTRAPVGDLLLYVWSTPTPPVAGRPLHITLAITRPADDDSETPITDATVTIRALPTAGAALITSAEPGANAGGFYYEADLTLPAGDWRIEIEVDPDQGAGGVAGFAVVAAPVGSVRLWMTGLGAVLVTAGVVLYVVALVRGRRKVVTAA